MPISSIKELKAALSLIIPARPEPIKGATESEIESVKAHQGVSFLPELYRQFLLEMGHGAGHFYKGEDYTIGYVTELKIFAKARLEDDKVQLLLPEDVFVFNMHQGYIFLFFHTGNHEENPPVYQYHQLHPESFYKISDPLLDHYNMWLDHLLKLVKSEEERRQNR